MRAHDRLHTGSDGPAGERALEEQVQLDLGRHGFAPYQDGDRLVLETDGSLTPLASRSGTRAQGASSVARVRGQ